MYAKAKDSEETSPKIGFFRADDGHLMCEGMRVVDIANLAEQSPFYLTSKGQLDFNFKAY